MGRVRPATPQARGGLLGPGLLRRAGAVSQTSDRLTIDFSLPGQPGTETANKIVKAFGNGGNTSPLLATVTLPQGQTVTGNEAAVADGVRPRSRPRSRACG